MRRYIAECDFELSFQPAMKKTPYRLQEIVAQELGVEPDRILSMEVEHDIPRVTKDMAEHVVLDHGKTTVTGSYERTSRY